MARKNRKGNVVSDVAARTRIILAVCLTVLWPAQTEVAAQGVSNVTRVAQADTTQPRQPSEVVVVPWRSQRFGNYQALVIGINGYSHLPKADQLTTAINDANAVAKLLFERYGFNVRVLRNPRRQTIFAALEQLRQELTEADRFLLYYAGRCHVDSKSTRGYWLPSDADLKDPATWIANGEVSDQLKAMKATHVLIVADSCYTGTRPYRLPPPPASEDRDAYLKRLAKMQSRTVLTSGSLQPAPDTAASQHSIFADAFMQALRDNEGVLEGVRLFAGLGSASTYATIDDSGHQDGDFIFVPRNR